MKIRITGTQASAIFRLQKLKLDALEEARRIDESITSVANAYVMASGAKGANRYQVEKGPDGEFYITYEEEDEH